MTVITVNMSVWCLFAVICFLNSCDLCPRPVEKFQKNKSFMWLIGTPCTKAGSHQFVILRCLCWVKPLCRLKPPPDGFRSQYSLLVAFYICMCTIVSTVWVHTYKVNACLCLPAPTQASNIYLSLHNGLELIDSVVCHPVSMVSAMWDSHILDMV